MNTVYPEDRDWTLQCMDRCGKYWCCCGSKADVHAFQDQWAEYGGLDVPNRVVTFEGFRDCADGGPLKMVAKANDLIVVTIAKRTQDTTVLVQ